MPDSQIRTMTFCRALIPVLFLMLALVYTIRILNGAPHIPLVLSAVVATIVAVSSGYRWENIERGIVNTIRKSMSAILILMIVGMIIGTWILAGIVPTMIYYGLKLIAPQIFLLATTVICAVVSVATGSSWTTAGTVGIALIGVGKGFGIPLPMVAGAIISGAYFGDKMSPLSDTTNLSPAMAGARLFEHIQHMAYTTGPSLLLTLMLYLILGWRFSGQQLDMDSIEVILNGLREHFVITPWLLLPPALVIAMVVFKIPAIPGLIGGTFLGGLCAALFQRAGLTQIVQAMHYGYKCQTGLAAVDSLLSRGGLDSMMWTVSLILCAMTLAGVLESSDMLNALSTRILKAVHSTGSLVTATVLACIGTNLIAGDQYLSIVVPGRMFRKVYQQRGLKARNLSRVLEDAGTLSSPLVPWNTCGAFMAATLGVHPFAYLPFAFLNLINPMISIFYGYTGLTMTRLSPEEMPAREQVEAEESL